MKCPSLFFLLLSASFFLSSARLEGQALGHWQGWCELGGHRDEHDNDFVQASYPSCTVDVYFTGSTTHAAIYSDLNSTLLPNPFAAAANGSIEFYAPQGVQYDIVASGADMPAPFTYPYVTLPGSGGILSSPSSPQTITGQMLTLSTSAPLLVQGATMLTETSTKSLNNVEFADRFAGRDACAKIHAAISALPAGGGIVDARGFQGTQACASDPFVGGTTPPVQLLIGQATFQLSTGWFPSAGSKITCLDPHQSTIAGASGFSTLTLQSDTTIENCHILGGYNGVTSLSTLRAARVVVRNNIVEGSVLGPNVNLGGGTTYWVVQGNVIRGGLNEGVLVNANGNADPDDPRCTSTDDCGYNQILDNWIYGNQKNGIDVNSSRNTIRGNHVFMNGGTGPTGGGMDQFGILLFAAQVETPVSHNIVSQNEVFSNNTFGIALIAAPGGSMSYNIVTDNSVRYNGTTASSGTADGIYLEAYQSGNVLNNVISNNIVVGNTRNGIYFNFPVPGPGIISANQVIGNQLLYNSQYGFATDGGGGGGGVFGDYVVNNVALGNIVGPVADFGSSQAVYSNRTSTTELLDVATGVFGSITPISMFTVSMTGIANDTAGFKHARFGSSCTVAPSATCASTYNWTTWFADTNYTVTCSLAGTIVGSPVISGISSKLTSGITITIANASTNAASASEVDCIAVHD
jgi:parallel beta-helix repeat protein